MAEFTDSAHVAVDPQVLFDYLSDISNLPRYFARMTSAAPGDGEEVHTTATVPGGGEVEGKAWFRVEDQQRRIKWGSEGNSDYHGSLEVSATDAGSEVEVHVHTERVPAGSEEVESGLTETLTRIKQLVEEG